jgi:hypothetical protein
MNCLEFHRQKLADPRRLSAQAREHVQGCANCAAFASAVDDGEGDLERVLGVPVPDGLAERVILRARRGQAAWHGWALAASVVIAVASAIALFETSGRPQDQYARLAIEHLVMEPESLTTVRNADAEAFRALVQSSGGTLKAPLGMLRYIRLCPVQDGTGWHIVFDTPEGLATLIIVPGKTPGATQAASTVGWSALARPTPRGYYAVVTTLSRATLRLDRLVSEQIAWDA